MLHLLEQDVTSYFTLGILVGSKLQGPQGEFLLQLGLPLCHERLGLPHKAHQVTRKREQRGPGGR